MALTVIPTNIGGTSISTLASPLAALFNPSTPKTLVYPSDLASNPAMNHAIQFSVYDYHTGFGDIVKQGTVISQEAINSGLEAAKKTYSDPAQAIEASKQALGSAVSSATDQIKNFKFTPEGVQSVANAIQNSDTLKTGISLFQAPTYKPRTKGAPLANISLFMPETLATQYNSNYTDISLTQELGMTGLGASAVSELLNKNPNLADRSVSAVAGSVLESEAFKNAAAFLGNKALGPSTALLQQAQNQFTNPQLQLLYQGIELRSFTFEFIFTPKSSQEAQAVNDIIDTFVFYSSPGLVNGGNNEGQYLTPPQLFSIKLAFLGKSGVAGSLSNIFGSALNNIGLGFLNTTNPTTTITSAPAAKIMTINECFLENVNVDYAPNGWAAYNDGYPIQTRLTLTFKETSIITKDSIKNKKIQDNYAYQQALNSQFGGNEELLQAQHTYGV